MAVAIGGEILSLWRLFTCLLMLVNVLHSSVADMDGEYTTDLSWLCVNVVS